MNRSSATPLVNRSIRNVAWPALRALGFLQATARTAWRTRADTIDVVNFQSAVSAGGDPLFLGSDKDGRIIEVTLGSFSVNVGCHYSVRQHLPWRPSVYTGPRKAERPEEFECDERLRLATRALQSHGYPAEIWEVRSLAPQDARLAVADALSAIQAQALPWFEEISDLERAFQRLKPVCWNWAEDHHREPDKFFKLEDLFAALAIRTGYADEALKLFRSIAARPFSSAEHADYLKAEARRQQRMARTKKPVLTEKVPFWHDGATARVAALEALLAER